LIPESSRSRISSSILHSARLRQAQARAARYGGCEDTEASQGTPSEIHPPKVGIIGYESHQELFPHIFGEIGVHQIEMEDGIVAPKSVEKGVVAGSNGDGIAKITANAQAQQLYVVSDRASQPLEICTVARPVAHPARSRRDEFAGIGHG